MKKTIASVLMLAGLIAAGCNTVPPYSEGRAEQYSPPQVMFTGPEGEDLRKSTVVDTPVRVRDGSDLLVVTLPLRATGRQILHTQYRITFLDEANQPLPGSPTGWLRKDLEPGGRELITFNSTSPRARDFQLELRYAR